MDSQALQCEECLKIDWEMFYLFSTLDSMACCSYAELTFRLSVTFRLTLGLPIESALYFQVCVQKVARTEPFVALAVALHRSISSGSPESHVFLPFQPVA